ncbi:protein-tyrosine-phosphatase [Planctomycetales bacterium]|nr:protein-tyrosine-phosphatase [Planctomycetales bacterium]GHT08185.1 protein-tyrosine-phosphatase [Planctomycetales bacterium]
MPFNFSFVIPGKLAGMGLPGMISPLAGELLQLRRQKIAALVSLTEEPLDAAAVAAAEMAYLHLPVPDFTPPQPAQIAALIKFIQEQNAQNRAVAVHCAGGYGRTGTMLACYLVALGETAEQAINAIRAIRPGSIETPAQEQCVRDFSSREFRVKSLE